MSEHNSLHCTLLVNSRLHQDHAGSMNDSKHTQQADLHCRQQMTKPYQEVAYSAETVWILMCTQTFLQVMAFNSLLCLKQHTFYAVPSYI